jgi:hypothetical protein
VQSYLSGQLDVDCRTGNEDVKVSGRNRPGMTLDVIIGERSLVKLDGDVPGLTRIQVYFGKTFQFLDGTRDGSMTIANEDFGYFCARTSAGVGYVEGNADLLVG